MHIPGQFEIKSTDLAGRIGVLETKSSKIQTPALLPVIHPVSQLVPCVEIRGMGFEAVMTNAYTTFKRLRDRAGEGIHKIIGFDGTIMTDSGGYQVLEFGSVDVGPKEMASFEEKLGSDIAIILDRPTGLEVARNYAAKTVADTLQAAKETLLSITRKDLVWTLPIQGGKYLDLVSKSARASAKLEYGCFALGSPVEVMENYDFPLLVRMIQASKTFLPKEKPFHLFGAGHPLIIPLAVALGCDMFDSASYMLYAKQDRYIGSNGTIRLEKLEHLPCNCRVCTSHTATELKNMRQADRVEVLAKHNLAALKLVIEETKQAIWEGRLWEFVRAKCSNHPATFEAFKEAVRSKPESFELGTPAFKERGIFLFDELDLQRPEILRHFKRLETNLDFGKKTHLVIAPETKTKPYLTSDLCKEIQNLVNL
ncbi:MAG: tRNA guanosine(15) transglycosylase TgtA, partial [Thaumarchaeota archaeon]|nr:tRNA guanosine(15) transglycosylase TgtA [Nitrososphaerota archaeon]